MPVAGVASITAESATSGRWGTFCTSSQSVCRFIVIFSLFVKPLISSIDGITLESLANRLIIEGEDSNKFSLRKLVVCCIVGCKKGF